MSALTLSAGQRRVLGSDEFSGPVQVCALGLPDREGPIVAYDDDHQVVIDPDGATYVDVEAVAS